MPAGVLGGALGEVLQAALGVVGQRIDVRDVLLGAGDAQRRAALGERPRAAHRHDGDVPLGRHERDRHQAMGGQAHAQVDRAVDADAPLRRVARSGSRQTASTVSAASSASRSARACSA